MPLQPCKHELMSWNRTGYNLGGSDLFYYDAYGKVNIATGG